MTGLARRAFSPPYNAGPDRVSSYIAGAADLPRETVNYLAAITPNLGTSVAFSGPLAVYAGNGRAYGGGYNRPVPTVASFAAGCDVNAAYDPEHPCQPLEQAGGAAGAHPGGERGMRPGSRL